jgi:hypothetical protein
MTSGEDEGALIRDWLSGKLKDGTGDDLAARRLIAQSLRSMKDPGILFAVADLIDPDSDHLTQKLILRGKRGVPRRVDHRAVAVHIWHQVNAGIPVESAVQGAMDEFDISRSPAMDAWSTWRPHFEKYPELVRD